MSDVIEFKEAGAFLRQQRKEKGYKTQKGFIAALKAIDPTISCSESYISLIEKGVKTPGVRLLDLMAKVLKLSASEKGELLLIYKRVPSDFEFAVRGQLKADSQLTRLDKIAALYQKDPNREHFKHYLKALILEDQTQAALKLLKGAPTFDNEVLELQERTAKIAIISGNFSFARQAFDLALKNCDLASERTEIFLYKGMAYFHEGLSLDSAEAIAALDLFLQALGCFESGLLLEPANLLLVDELARCTYHIGDCLLYLSRQENLQQQSFKPYPYLIEKLKLSSPRPSAKHFSEQSMLFFEQSRAAYALVLSRADLSPLPDKPMQEAVFFHAYVHAKLQLFPLARVLIHSNMIMQRNWLTCFMKAGLAIMEYEATPQSDLLKQGLYYLNEAYELDSDAVCDLIVQEKERELALLWKKCSNELEALLKQHENA